MNARRRLWAGWVLPEAVERLRSCGLDDVLIGHVKDVGRRWHFQLFVAADESRVVSCLGVQQPTNGTVKLMSMTQHCCEAMARQVNRRCDQHDDPFACPDALVRFDARFQEYGLIIHDGGGSTTRIDFCPWCGQRLPESQRDRWFKELEGRGIDPWEGEIPPEFRDDRWLRDASER